MVEDGRSRDAMRRIFQARYGLALPVYTPVVFSDTSDKKVVDNPAPKTYSDEKERPANLSEDEKAVLSLLSGKAIHSDTLVAESGLPAQRVTAALTLLQIKQLALKLAGNYYQRKF